VVEVGGAGRGGGHGDRDGEGDGGGHAGDGADHGGAGGGGKAAVVTGIETEVSGEEVEAEWTYTYGAVNTGSEEAPAGGGSAGQLPAYRAEVKVEGYPMPMRTGLLTYEDKGKVEVTDEQGNACQNDSYHLTLSNDEVRSSSLDRQGKTREQTLPPGSCTLSFRG
jgi:hypothetical protein